VTRIRWWSLLGLGAAFCSLAQAQSSATLFGIVDASLRYAKNGDDSATTLSSGGLNTDRVGYHGIEDLGEGFKAGFWLEGGFNIYDGTQSDSSRFFNRRATVSLLGKLGEVRVGRDYSVTYNGYADFDPFGSNGVGSADKFQAKLGTTVNTLTRADDQVVYFTPATLGGFYGEGGLAAGEGISGDKYFAGRGGYASGPLDISITYGQTMVTPNASGDDWYRTFEIGASYTIGVVKLLGYCSDSKYSDLRMVVCNGGALIHIGRGTIRVGYINANASGGSTDANDAHQIALGYVYDMSKDTALYATAAKVSNKGSAAFVVSTPPSAVAGRDSTGCELGIRHHF
jgi:predicted porin